MSKYPTLLHLPTKLEKHDLVNYHVYKLFKMYKNKNNFLEQRHNNRFKKYPDMEITSGLFWTGMVKWKKKVWTWSSVNFSKHSIV